MTNLESKGPSISREIEGAYRRGYHQAIAEVADALRSNSHLTAADFKKWVEGPGMHWRKDAPLEQMYEPPLLISA